MADDWSTQTDILISVMEPTIQSKFGISLRDLLNDPGKYAGTEGLDTKVSNIKEEIGNYVSSTIDSMPDDKRSFEDDAIKCDSMTKQLNQNISLQTKQNNVPLIKPDSMDRNVNDDQVVYINAVDNSVLSLVQKLAATSIFVADFSKSYRNYNIGEWFFSGQKNYVIRVNLQPSALITLDSARDELSGLLDEVVSFAP